MAKRPGTNKENSEETRRLLIAAAQSEFAENGYTRASTNAIITGAGVARGSLYYHFKDKEDLFKAVYSSLTDAANEEIKTTTKDFENSWDILMAGARFYLAHAQNPVYRRIVMFEALIALNYADRMAALNESLLKSLYLWVGQAQEDGYLSKDRKQQEWSLLIYAMLLEFGRQLEPYRERDTNTNAESLFALFEWTMNHLKLGQGAVRDPAS